MLTQTNNSLLRVATISGFIAALLVGVAALDGSARESFPVQGQGLVSQSSVPAFTLTTSRKFVPTGERERLVSTQQRFQRTDGLYKLVQTFYGPDGNKVGTQTYFGFLGLGVFRLDEAGQRLVFAGPLIDDRQADIETFLRRHELFTREESVAGISTIVWRQEETDPSTVCEEYRAPSLGGLLIKTVKVSERERETVEPTEIQMGEPFPGLFGELNSYRADYSSYAAQVQQTEKKNDPEMAGLMRQLLERMRQARPN